MTKPTTNLLKKVLTNRKVRREVTGASHYWFFHTYFPHYITYKTADFQREIFTLSENEKIKNLVIIAFRGSGKSTIINLSYPLWAILGKPQKKFVLIVGQTQNQARQHLRNIKCELESNDLLRKDLGPFQEENDDWNNSSLLIPQHNARITAVSMEQSVRGIRHGQYRPDLIICDDIEDMSSVKTREGREKTHTWLTSEVIPAGDKNTRLVMIGNLLHEDSAIMRMKDKISTQEMNGEYRAYPIVSDEEILWPGKFPNLESVAEERKRVANQIAWKREYELTIVPDDGQIVPPEDIHYYDKIPAEVHGCEYSEGIEFRFYAIGTDLAISQKESADYTAFVPIQVMRVGKQRQLYILPNLLNARMDFSQSKENLKALAQTYTHLYDVTIFIENVGYQEAFAQEMKKEGCYIKSIKISSDKHARLRLAHHYIKNGNVLFPRQGCERLIEQIMGFGVEKHDDLMDAFTIAVNELMREGECTSLPQAINMRYAWDPVNKEYFNTHIDLNKIV